ncbi:MAG: serine hydrolase [Caldilineaceae bacterium]|nr:serine hydrolase [Caldilineaceae bacterium]
MAMPLRTPPDAADGPFPLVIHSHAWSSFQHELPYLSEQLASQGFVVLAPGHEDNWSKLSIPAPLGSEFRRPDEVRRTIDFAEELTAAGGELAGMVDVEHVGVAGWSHGGETALVASGARLDLANFVAWCEANTIDDTPPSDNCAEAQANQEELAQLIGLDAVPVGLWPDLGDARIDAAVALAPSTDLLGPEGLGSIDVPTLFILGSGDTSVGPFYFENAAFAQVNAARKAEVLLNDAEHLVFFSECSEIPEVVDLGFYFFCSDPVWDMDRAHDLTNHFTTAFFLAELKGDDAAAAALAPRAVTFPGITFQSQGYAQSILNDEVIGQIEEAIAQTMEEGAVPGVAIGIVEEGELTFAQGYGLADVESASPMTPMSLFHIASVSKTFVAAALMQLADAGMVDLDDPVTAYLPYFTLAEPESQAITIRELLSHTSGMPDVGSWFGAVRDQGYADDDALEEYVRSLAALSLIAPPGEGFAYSSIGFDVLGDVIAKASGQSFEDYMTEHLLQPMGMESSSFMPTDLDLTLRATPYTFDEAGHVVPIGYFPYSRPHAPASGLWTNVEDLGRYARTLLQEGESDGLQILPRTATGEMWKPVVDTGWAEWFGPTWKDYGLGWLTGEAGGYTIPNHTGAMDEGYQAHLLLIPDQEVAVVALVNIFDREDGQFRAYEIADKTMEILLREMP